ncbi:MAG: rod shape-determining protein [Bacilli bacterium]|nr:rod shape-determining protein [Bacilli bacterium]
MSSDKPCAAIEITNKAIKIVVGHEINGKVYVVYSLIKNLGTVRNGKAFIDPQNTISNLEAIKSIKDESAKIQINVVEALVSIPPENLMIYETHQVTTVLSEESKVANIDIRNIYTLIRKGHLGLSTTNQFVDIIPDRYILDQGRTSLNPPIGETTNTLTLYARVHTIDRSTIEGFNEIVSGAGIYVKRNVVAPFAACELLSTMEEVPQDYILVDIGAKQSTVSLVGRKQLHSSAIINWGGDNITHRIQEKFSIRENQAEKIKMMYGIDKRETNFRAPVCITHEEDGTDKKYYIDDLNALTKGELDVFISKLNETINNLLNGINPIYKQLPMILIGGGSLLKGLKEYILPKVQSQSVDVIIPKVMGARNPALFNCLGMLLVQSKYQPVFDENHPKVGQVTRNTK